jgi:hypothetical protein
MITPEQLNQFARYSDVIFTDKQVLLLCGIPDLTMDDIFKVVNEINNYRLRHHPYASPEIDGELIIIKITELLQPRRSLSKHRTFGGKMRRRIRSSKKTTSLFPKKRKSHKRHH